MKSPYPNAPADAYAETGFAPAAPREARSFGAIACASPSCLSESAIALYVDGKVEASSGRGAGASGSLRAEIEQHLAECDECRALVSELARVTIPPGTSSGVERRGVPPHALGGHAARSTPGDGGSRESEVDQAHAARLAPGRIFAGKYRIERALGRGGMGVVLAARHELLGHEVAIKVLGHELQEDAEARVRLLREARAAAKLRSDHVARVFDVGLQPDGAPFVVLEKLEGETLAERLERRGPLPVEDVVRFVLEACEALAEAHHAGIVHRDVKPSNLFVETVAVGAAAGRSPRERIKVLDFGIAKAPRAAEFDAQTTTGALGSPRYMSPEQMRSTRLVDARTDVWSLGVTTFELLTGAAPFRGDTLPALATSILMDPIPSLRAHRPDVPERLDAIVTRCLAREPNERFADAAELEAALLALHEPPPRVSLPAAAHPANTPPATRVSPVRATGGPRLALYGALAGLLTTLLAFGAPLLRAKPEAPTPASAEPLHAPPPLSPTTREDGESKPPIEATRVESGRDGPQDAASVPQPDDAPRPAPKPVRPPPLQKKPDATKPGSPEGTSADPHGLYDRK
jgi:serine/threonine-protein kinase